MDKGIVEKSYPITFREVTADALGKQLRLGHSVNIIGMKRVGISNFLRFFLYREGVKAQYVGEEREYLFIPVDLNDLVEREMYPFWMLTFKRVVDALGKSQLRPEVKKQIEGIFLSSIQLQDLFMLIDGVRQALVILCDNDLHPTFFFLRFDRIREVVTPTFFNNLQGLRDATNQKLSYVFTSFRSLDVLSPEVLEKSALFSFAHLLYLPPATHEDMHTVYDAYAKRYDLNLSASVEKALFELVDGNVQYMQLALIVLHEKGKKSLSDKNELVDLLTKDERIWLYSEELWESLQKTEKEAIMKAMKNEELTEDERKKASYVWDAGFIGGDKKLFSPLFAFFLEQKKQTDVPTDTVHFSKKEHLLFELLLKHKEELCERETIISTVWPEYQDFGVSDWAIDRLVARVRSKLKDQQSSYEIKTIRTRGYKLLSIH